MKSKRSILILFLFCCMLITACSKELPIYDSRQAIANGDVVYAHRQITNLDKLENFIDNVHNRKKDKVIITTYTIEGDAIIQTLQYDEKNIDYDIDTRRDKFAAETDRKIEKYQFANIEKETNEDMVNYYLCNNDKSNKMDILEINKTPKN